MSRLFKLLQLAVIGSRDAAGNRHESIAVAEFSLARRTLAAIMEPLSDRYKLVSLAIDDYSRFALERKYEYMLERASAYRYFADARNDAQVNEHALEYSNATAAALRVLTDGMAVVGESFNNHDLIRCEIELEHLHNLPAIIESKSRQSMVYYLSVERECYLKNIGENYGEEMRRESEQRYFQYWKTMS